MFTSKITSYSMKHTPLTNTPSKSNKSQLRGNCTTDNIKMAALTRTIFLGLVKVKVRCKYTKEIIYLS